MIESLGITEQAMDMPIRASMEVVQLTEVASGPVFMDRYCHAAAGVLVVNRVKLHTCFSGPVQSGLTKMMVVGMGKIRSGANLPLDAHCADERHVVGDGPGGFSYRQDLGGPSHFGRWL